ncbi:MAG: retroviral-like aspartic protease family protein [Chloroflexota bacterium]
MVFTYDYDTGYNGPALPVVEVGIQAMGKNDRRTVLKAMVDSGADATMIPVRHLTRIGARKVDKRWMRGIDGLRYPVDIYGISVTVGPHTFHAVEVIGDRQNQEALLGRDVLNQMVVTLNGLAYVVEISQ